LETKTNYTMVGLIVLILGASLLVASLWLSAGFNQKTYKIYAVHVHEAVTGLNPESPVKFNGVKVGYVYKISLSRVDPQCVILLLRIEEGTPITISTSATLVSLGITGTTYIGLSASSPDLTPLQKKPDEPYPVIPTNPSMLNQIDKAVKDITDVSHRVKKVFNAENTEHLKNILINLHMFSTTLAQNSQTINRSLQNSDKLLSDMASVSKHLKANMAKVTRTVYSAGDSVTATMKAGKKAINKISDQAVPPAVVLLRQLNTIAANLEKVSNQLRQNPSVVIRGTTAPQLGPGEHK